MYHSQMQDDLFPLINLLTVYVQHTTTILMDVNLFHNMQDFAPKCSGGLAKKVRWFDPKDAVL